MNKPNCNRCGNQMRPIWDAPWFCVICPDEPPAPTYTDDIVAVMRDTISAQRETIANLRERLAHTEACREQFMIAEQELVREVARLRAQLAGSPLPEGM